MSVIPGRGTKRDDREAAELISRIDEMLESGEFDWAEDTLSGIRDTVEKSGRVSEGQARAIDNIESRGH